MTTPTIDDHHHNATKYPICGKCGTVWHKHGNRTGHCANCHQTFEGISLFDRHQHLDENGTITCTPGEEIKLRGEPLKNVAGAWQGPRMPADVIARRFSRPRHAASVTSGNAA